MFRKLFAVAMFGVLAGCANLGAGSADRNDTAEVTAAVETLRQAMLKPSREALSAITSDDLSYGHSGGRIDTKDSFIGDLLNGKSVFVTLAFADQTVKRVGSDVAMVRNTLIADTNDSGTPGKVNIKVLTVWQKQAGQWRLFARQAVRPPAS